MQVFYFQHSSIVFSRALSKLFHHEPPFQENRLAVPFFTRLSPQSSEVFPKQACDLSPSIPLFSTFAE